MNTIQGLLQVALTVQDLPRSVAFYRDCVGLPLLFEVPGPNPMAFFRCGDTRLMLTLPEQAGEPHHVSILYFRVADIHTASRDMAAKGVAFEGEPHCIAKMPDHELWMAFFRDPDRNVMALASEVRG
jgi:methylmalonyl-CoA/ethylmalonyl-CoA epimerase